MPTFIDGHLEAQASDFSAILSHRYSPIGIAEVAAGEGALHTCKLRGLSANKKSCTSVPSLNT
ncbi:hypothetical protein, partial [Klebsiella variicola]|uniref:hypothetical protein n=1 Tax=Klebsiella variicola TaxID=244366 RepID=UPI001C405C55